MIRNYLKIAWRSLLKNSLQTSINLLGLTIGTICCLSILVYVFAQLDYDTHHTDADALYRVHTFIRNPDGQTFNAATCSPPIAFALKEDFPEVVEATRIVYLGESTEELIRASNSTTGFYEPRGYLADPSVFSIFTYDFIEGKPATALVEPNTVVLSATLAKKLFGNQTAIDKTIISGSGEEQLTLTVSGVFDDKSGKRSHLNPNYFVTIHTPGLGAFVKNEQNFATQNFIHTYVKLNDAKNATTLADKLPSFLNSRGAKDIAAVGFEKKLSLLKVTDIHLRSKDISFQIETVSDINYLYMLVVLALFIQLAACINFINLSTARANKRAKEIGVRKAIGADKKSLVSQFLGESVLLSLFATGISIPITALLLPLVNRLTKGDLDYSNLMDWKILTSIWILGTITGFIAGIYPALVMSAIKPIGVLKGSLSLPSENQLFRKGLVIFQFVISIGLIATVIIITQQVKYAQNKDLGYDRENLIAIRLGTDDASDKYEALKVKIQSVPGITFVSGSNHYPSQFVMGDIGGHLPGGNPTEQVLIKNNGISNNYLDAVGTKLLTGRQLHSEDSNSIIVNKATIDAFNIKLEEAVGTKILSTYEDETHTYEIVGVTENFHYASLKETVNPLLLYYEDQPDWLLVRTETTDFNMILKEMKTAWKSLNKSTPFVYTFVDQETEKLIAEEKRLANIAMVFTALAILISCLGLFGLISFLAEQKKKEIGIRKVLGANVSTIMKMLTKDFFILIMIAFVIATPVTYYLMENWLQDFTYRITIHWCVFVLAGCVTVIITLLTVSVQTFKSATANPAHSLRTE